MHSSFITSGPGHRKSPSIVGTRHTVMFLKLPHNLNKYEHCEYDIQMLQNKTWRERERERERKRERLADRQTERSRTQTGTTYNHATSRLAKR